MLLALAMASVMLFAGVGALWALAVLVVWCYSLWVGGRRVETGAPSPPFTPPRRDPGDAREAIAECIEQISLPLLLMDARRIIAANAGARAALGNHILGQDARISLRHPEAVRLLDLPDGTAVSIAGLSGPGRLWQLTKHRIDPSLWLIELLDRTGEVDMGRAHTDFVANASHELRTPLSAIIGYGETLVDDMGAENMGAEDIGAHYTGTMDAGTRARFLGVILREARRMQSLVADLMSLSQLEAEKHDTPTAPLDLGQVAARVVGEFAGNGPMRVTLERDDKKREPVFVDDPTKRHHAPARGDAPLSVAGDAAQLEQLLRNLIDNALKYADPEAAVTISLSADDRGMAVLSVADQGPGIAPEHIPLLTRRFYRTDPGRSRAAGGTGLGLAIVKHIVERHRGRLDIASQLGVGTTVTVRLPLLVPLPDPAT